MSEVPEFIGISPQTKGTYQKALKVAKSDSTVLISGETGVGKGLLARIIHAHSPREGNPFVTVSCGVTNPDLLDSELFGHTKGAFTGANTIHIGKFESANGGTVLIDEVGNACERVQMKLLRVLDDKEIEPLGSWENIKINVRIIAATNHDLLDAIRKGQFRKDLYYRLNVIPIFIPPLRERKEDIPILFNYFLGKYSQKSGIKIPSLPRKTLEFLNTYSWPGNVRELKNYAERIVATAEGDIVKDEEFLQLIYDEKEMKPESAVEVLKEIENRTIITAMVMNNCRIASAAKALGIGRNTLSKKLKDIDISKELANLISSPVVNLKQAREEHITKALVLSEGNVENAAKLLGLPSSSLKGLIKKYKINTESIKSVQSCTKRGDREICTYENEAILHQYPPSQQDEIRK